jgi:hypothetical protein
MARCNVEGCSWYGKRSGLPIHLARVHGIHPQHESLASESNVLASESKVCPVPGCGQEVGDLEGHLEEKHESWRLSSGKWVFDV